MFRGDIDDYLGITLYYSKNGKVAVDITEYIQTKILTDNLNNFNGTAVTPAENYLFEVDENCPKLGN